MSDVSEAPPRAHADTRPLQGSHVWYELMTTDPVSAKKFYDAVVGWNIDAQAMGEMDYRMIGRSDGGFAGGVLGLSDKDCAEGAFPTWMGYIGVDDVDATVADVVKRGGRSIMAAFDIPQGRIAMVADPQGYPFYVMKPVPPAGQEGKQSDVFSETEPQRVSWNELTTSDPEAARTFYGELFGWTSDEFMPMGELGDYRFFARNGQRIGALCPVQPDGSAGWRYYIRVPSISKSIEAVKAGGGIIGMGPQEVPTGDHIIIGKDPQGAEFALVGKL